MGIPYDSNFKGSALGSSKTQKAISKKWAKVFPGKVFTDPIQVKQPKSKYMSARLIILEEAIKANQSKPQASRVLQNAAIEFVIIQPEAMSSLKRFLEND